MRSWTIQQHTNLQQILPFQQASSGSPPHQASRTTGQILNMKFTGLLLGIASKKGPVMVQEPQAQASGLRCDSSYKCWALLVPQQRPCKRRKRGPGPTEGKVSRGGGLVEGPGGSERSLRSQKAFGPFGSTLFALSLCGVKKVLPKGPWASEPTIPGHRAEKNWVLNSHLRPPGERDTEGLRRVVCSPNSKACRGCKSAFLKLAGLGCWPADS